jgi:hypothetical protein
MCCRERNKAIELDTQRAMSTLESNESASSQREMLAALDKRIIVLRRKVASFTCHRDTIKTLFLTSRRVVRIEQCERKLRKCYRRASPTMVTVHIDASLNNTSNILR